MLGKCACCEVYKEQVKHLQGLLDQTLALIAPKTGEPVDEPVNAEDKIIEQFGDQ